MRQGLADFSNEVADARVFAQGAEFDETQRIRKLGACATLAQRMPVESAHLTQGEAHPMAYREICPIQDFKRINRIF